MERDRIAAFLGKDWEDVQRMMKDALKSDVVLLQEVNDSILDHAGKQLRPALSLLMARACSPYGTTEDSAKFATAAELLHNATLLHDDVTDRSSTRRGEPTVWARMGATPAVLIGDFWLARAVSLVVDTKRRDRVVESFCASMRNLAEGELLQMQKAETADTTEEDYLRIIQCKTASLFEASIVSGAISVDASEELLEAARSYAHALGLAFQIRDDILDYCGKEEMGKPSGVDLKEKKITLPLLGALKDSPEEARIRGMVREMDSKPENVLAVWKFVMDNGGIQYASSVLDRYVGEALEALDAFEDSEEKSYLAQIAQYNRIRET